VGSYLAWEDKAKSWAALHKHTRAIHRRSLLIFQPVCFTPLCSLPLSGHQRRCRHWGGRGASSYDLQRDLQRR
jgi:hypothetical protein